MGVIYAYSIGQHWTNIELYIDKDKQPSGRINKVIFDALHVDKATIESEFGAPLNWYRLNDKRASRITYVFEGGYDDPEKWSDLQGRMIDAMIKLEKAFSKRLKAIKV